MIKPASPVPAGTAGYKSNDVHRLIYILHYTFRSCFCQYDAACRARYSEAEISEKHQYEKSTRFLYEIRCFLVEISGIEPLTS